jgi:hypothetical protein
LHTFSTAVVRSFIYRKPVGHVPSRYACSRHHGCQKTLSFCANYETSVRARQSWVRHCQCVRQCLLIFEAAYIPRTCAERTIADWLPPGCTPAVTLFQGYAAAQSNSIRNSMMLHQELGTKLTNMSQEVGNEMGAVGTSELRSRRIHISRLVLIRASGCSVRRCGAISALNRTQDNNQ